MRAQPLLRTTARALAVLLLAATSAFGCSKRSSSARSDGPRSIDAQPTSSAPPADDRGSSPAATPARMLALSKPNGDTPVDREIAIWQGKLQRAPDGVESWI